MVSASSIKRGEINLSEKKLWNPSFKQGTYFVRKFSVLALRNGTNNEILKYESKRDINESKGTFCGSLAKFDIFYCYFKGSFN